MYGIPSEKVEKIRETYPVGCRVKLLSMDDPYTKLKSGDLGTIRYVDDTGTIHVNWDCGSSLGLILGVDDFVVEA